MKEVFEKNGVFECQQFVTEYNFYMEPFRKNVTIKIYKQILPDHLPEFTYDISHSIKTPTQAGPYRSSRVHFNSISELLHEVFYGIRMFTNEAISSGHAPSNDWLVPNGNFYASEDD